MMEAPADLPGPEDRSVGFFKFPTFGWEPGGHRHLLGALWFRCRGVSRTLSAGIWNISSKSSSVLLIREKRFDELCLSKDAGRRLARAQLLTDSVGATPVTPHSCCGATQCQALASFPFWFLNIFEITLSRLANDAEHLDNTEQRRPLLTISDVDGAPDRP
jgi:hypothetical protein